MPLHFAAWRDAFALAAAPFDFDWTRFMSRAGLTLEQTVIELNAEFSCNLDLIEVSNAQRASYLRRQNQITKITFVTDFAEELLGKVPLAVASGSSRQSVEHSLRATEIFDWFDVVVTANDVVRGKPEPDIFLDAARKMGVSPPDCLVVEDGLPGIRGAHAAHMDAYLIDRSGACQFLPTPKATRQFSA